PHRVRSARRESSTRRWTRRKEKDAERRATTPRNTSCRLAFLQPLSLPYLLVSPRFFVLSILSPSQPRRRQTCRLTEDCQNLDRGEGVGRNVALDVEPAAKPACASRETHLGWLESNPDYRRCESFMGSHGDRS